MAVSISGEQDAADSMAAVPPSSWPVASGLCCRRVRRATAAMTAAMTAAIQALVCLIPDTEVWATVKATETHTYTA